MGRGYALGCSFLRRRLTTPARQQCKRFDDDERRVESKKRHQRSRLLARMPKSLLDHSSFRLPLKIRVERVESSRSTNDEDRRNRKRRRTNHIRHFQPSTSPITYVRVRATFPWLSLPNLLLLLASKPTQKIE